MRELNTLLGPYLKRRWRVHQRRGKPQRLWSRWKRWGPGTVGLGSANLWGRPAPGWAPWCPLRPDASSVVMNFGNMVHGQKFARKDVQIIFPKGFLKLRKYFWCFCEKGKVLEKFQHAENTFENFQICSGEKQMRCKENLKRRKNKYEINTNLPLARARRLKSDVHDFSPSFLPFVCLSWRTGRG